MKTTDIIIYHADCVDGMAAAWVARSAVLDKRPLTNLKLVPMHYPDKFDYDLLADVSGGPIHIHILDFSLPIGDLIALYNASNFDSLTYIDHHPTGEIPLLAAEQRFKGALTGEVDCIFATGPGVSGASLAWEHYFHDLPKPRGIMRVADRDTWTFGYTDSKNFHAFAALFLTKSYMWDGVFEDANFESAVASGEAVRMHMDDIATKYAAPDRWQRISYNGFDGAVLNINREHVSDASEKILELNPDIKFVICFQVKPATIKFDFRSRQGEGLFNCGEVAKLFGGGGHVGAGGVEVEKSSAHYHALAGLFGLYLS